MLSMTGYGAAEIEWDDQVIQAEVRSVNHRYGEVSVKLPREWLFLEDPLRRLALERLKRGKIDIYVNVLNRQDGPAGPLVDWQRAEEYVRIAREMTERFGLTPLELSARDLLALPGVTEPARGRQVDREELQRRLTEVLSAALDALVEMRRREGAHLKTDLQSRLDRLTQCGRALAELAPAVPEAARERLRQRLSQWGEASAIDPDRLAQEVALIADRSDVTEELTRLSSHFAQAKTLLDAKEPVGRKLDFLLQEMHRETNTIGSKSGDARISALVVEMKAELEKMREQVQNVE